MQSVRIFANDGKKELFVAAEVFGKILSTFSKKEGKPEAASSSDTETLKDIAERIRSEYEDIFWATGKMDVSKWASNCTFEGT